MNSAMKPVVASAGSTVAGVGVGVSVASGQASPAKGSAAGVNHASVPPSGANSVHNNLQTVGQNLTQHAGAAQPPPHAQPSMAPVTPNMAQMAQNMSHHGNLSHVTQNSAPPAAVPNTASASPAKAAPLSLVQDKPPPSQPLALTRTPEKKEPDATGSAGSGPANGTVDSPKAATNAPNTLKPQNPETNKDKQDIAKTSPSTPKPPEKASTAPSTPQKPEAGNSVTQVDGPSQPKVATASEPPEKSPSKPTEPKPVSTADVAPTQSDSKSTPETANDNQTSKTPEKVEKVPTPAKETKQEPSTVENSKTETSEKEQKHDNAKPDKPTSSNETKDNKEPEKETPKKEDLVEKPKTEEKEKVETKKSESKESKPKSTLKLATVTPPLRKRRHTSPPKGNEGSSSAKKPAEESTPTSEKRSKRNRTKVQLYQSPTPEITMATKLSASAAGRSTPTKQNDDKLIVFYKNEYLAVRNAEGSFYVCQAMQNVYRTTRKIKIRWLSQDKTIDPSGETYKPDFYDVTDMECVLTTLCLSRSPGGGGAQVLSGAERGRATSILQRALRAEQGRASPPTNPEHPDGLDLSLYTDESQLDKKSSRKRNSSKSSPRNKQDTSVETAKETATPAKKTRTPPKRSPKSSRKTKSPTVKTQNNKRKTLGNTSKTATAVSEKAKVSPKNTPPKRSKPIKVDKPETPVRKGRRSAAKVEPPKPVPVPVAIVATPSTSTGKTGRTPRKPPSRKI